jgi:hypothetical protein
MPARTPESVLDPYRPLLGNVPDQQIARQAGVSRALVLAWRWRLGVGPYEGYKFGAPGRKGTPRTTNGGGFRGRRSALDPYLHLLGTVPDAEVARLAGVTAENVRTYRTRRGIPARWQDVPRPRAEPGEIVARSPAAPRRRPEPVAIQPEPPRRPGMVYAVTVRLGEETRVYGLLALDTADAIRRAAVAIDAVCPEGRIKGVQCVGELLEAG